MIRRDHLMLAAAACAVLATSGAAALAEPAQAGGKQVTVIRKGPGSEVRIERKGGDAVFIRRERHEDMAARLRAILQLKPAQEAALSAYVQALEPKGPMVRVETHEGPMTTPQRLDEEEKMMSEHEAMMRARIEATRRFYAQLDPAQQKAFDALDLAERHMGMVRFVRVRGPMGMPHMPHMPPMPHMPAPPAPAPGL